MNPILIPADDIEPAAPLAPNHPPQPQTEVWLIRHAESVGNRDGRLQGQQDLPLSRLGEQQAMALAQRLAGMNFGALYSSDLARALDTAMAIGRILGMAVVPDKQLREIDVGTWSGLTAEEIQARHSREWARWQKRRDPTHRRGGGESYQDLQTRLVLAMGTIILRHPGVRILVVSHGGSINSYLAHLLDMPLNSLWRLNLSNTSISRVLPMLTIGEDRGVHPGRVLSINDSAHLDHLPR